MTPRLEGTSGRALLRVREQARIQLEGRRELWPKHELLLPETGGADRAGARPGLAAAAVAGRPVLRHRGRPVRLRGRARLPLRGARDGRHVPRLLVARRRRRVLAAGRATGVRAADRLRHGPPRAGPDAPRLPLRAVRADRPEAADGPLRHARGGGRSAAARGRHGRPAAGRPPVAARLGRELLDQEDGGVLRLHPRDRPARRRLEHRRLRAMARARRWRAAGGQSSRADRALQPRRRREQPAAPRLAGDLPRRAGPADRPGGAATGRPAGAPAERGDREPGSDPGPRRPAGRSGGRGRRPRPRARPNNRRAGCSPSCSAGIAARTSRCGGSSTG